MFGLSCILAVLAVSVTSVSAYDDLDDLADYMNDPSFHFITCPMKCFCDEKMVLCRDANYASVPQIFSKAIQELAMDGNNLTSLRKTNLERYRFLRKLNLYDNSLGYIEQGTFSKLKHLRELNLGRNKLRHLDRQMFAGLEKLRILNLEANGLTTIPDVLPTLPRLNDLKLGGNRLTEIAKDAFMHNPKLRLLNVSHNDLTNMDADVLKPLPRLRYLLLNNNPLGESASNLDISNNKLLYFVDFSDTMLRSIIRNLPKSLVDLRLSNNYIDWIYNDNFKDATSLDIFIINNNTLSYIEDRALENLTNLRELWLSYNKLQKIPRLPSHLRALYADFNEIVRIQRNTFQNCPKLEFLSMQKNNIQDIESESFKNLSLRSVDLSANKIFELRTLTFCNLKKLEQLDLSVNPVMKLDALSMHNVDNLRVLQMARINGQDAVDFDAANLAMLGDMGHLTHLDLFNSPEIAKKWIDSKKHLKEVQSLNLMFDGLITLPQDFPMYVPKIRNIRLAGNNWHCNESMIWFHYWIKRFPNLFFARHHVVCYTPLHLRYRPIFSVPVKEFLRIRGPPKELPAKPQCIDCDKGSQQPEIGYPVDKTTATSGTERDTNRGPLHPNVAEPVIEDKEKTTQTGNDEKQDGDDGYVIIDTARKTEDYTPEIVSRNKDTDPTQTPDKTTETVIPTGEIRTLFETEDTSKEPVNTKQRPEKPGDSDPKPSDKPHKFDINVQEKTEIKETSEPSLETTESTWVKIPTESPDRRLDTTIIISPDISGLKKVTPPEEEITHEEKEKEETTPNDARIQTSTAILETTPGTTIHVTRPTETAGGTDTKSRISSKVLESTKPPQNKLSTKILEMNSKNNIPDTEKSKPKQTKDTTQKAMMNKTHVEKDNDRDDDQVVHKDKIDIKPLGNDDAMKVYVASTTAATVKVTTTKTTIENMKSKESAPVIDDIIVSQLDNTTPETDPKETRESLTSGNDIEETETTTANTPTLDNSATESTDAGTQSKESETVTDELTDTEMTERKPDDSKTNQDVTDKGEMIVDEMKKKESEDKEMKADTKGVSAVERNINELPEEVSTDKVMTNEEGMTTSRPQDKEITDAYEGVTEDNTRVTVTDIKTENKDKVLIEEDTEMTDPKSEDIDTTSDTDEEIEETTRFEKNDKVQTDNEEKPTESDIINVVTTVVPTEEMTKPADIKDSDKEKQKIAGKVLEGGTPMPARIISTKLLERDFTNTPIHYTTGERRWGEGTRNENVKQETKNDEGTVEENEEVGKFKDISDNKSDQSEKSEFSKTTAEEDDKQEQIAEVNKLRSKDESTLENEDTEDNPNHGDLMTTQAPAHGSKTENIARDEVEDLNNQIEITTEEPERNDFFDQTSSPYDTERTEAKEEVTDGDVQAELEIKNDMKVKQTKLRKINENTFANNKIRHSKNRKKVLEGIHAKFIKQPMKPSTMEANTKPEAGQKGMTRTPLLRTHHTTIPNVKPKKHSQTLPTTKIEDNIADEPFVDPKHFDVPEPKLKKKPVKEQKQSDEEIWRMMDTYFGF